MDVLYEFVREVFKLTDGYELSDSLGPGEVPGWDSLGGINLINSLQERFRVELSLEDMARIGSIGDLRLILIDKGVLGAD